MEIWGRYAVGHVGAADAEVHSLIVRDVLIQPQEEAVCRPSGMNRRVVVTRVVAVGRRRVIGKWPQGKIVREQRTLQRERGVPGGTGATRNVCLRANLRLSVLRTDPVAAAVKPVERVENLGVHRGPVLVVNDRLGKVSLMIQERRHAADDVLARVKTLTFPAKEKEGAISSRVHMWNIDRSAEGEAVVILMECLARHNRVGRVLYPLIGVQELIAEILEQAPVVATRSALRVDRDDATGIAAVVGRQNPALHAEFADFIRGWDGTIRGIEFLILNLIAIDGNVRPIHLTPGNRIRIAGLCDE